MHVALTPAQERLREELRAYFAELITPELRAGLADLPGGEFGDGTHLQETVIRQLGADGWLGIGWPKEYGGQDRAPIEQLIFSDEASGAGVPVPLLTLNTVGPTLMQLRHRGAEGRTSCRRSSPASSTSPSATPSPSAGTDLASLQTKAVRDGDE